MFDLPEPIAVAIIALFSCAVAGVLLRGRPIDERRVLAFGLGMHLLFAIALKYSQGNVFGEGDVWAYRDFSTPMIPILRDDPFRWIPEVIKATFQLDNDLFEVHDSSGSMVTATALGRLAAFNSFYALYVLVGFLSFLSKWLVYVVFRDELPTMDRRYIALAAVCVPSVVFWTSGVVKEAYAFIGLGPLFYGACLFIKRRYSLSVVPIISGALIVGTFKPYVLFPFALGGMIWLIFERSSRARAHAPFVMLVAAFLGYVIVVGLGQLFPQFSPTQVVDQAAALQRYGAEAGGGSHYEVVMDQSFGGQILYAPLALLTTLTRPAPWEVHNVPAAIAAAEMTILTLLFIRGLLQGKGASIRTALGVPVSLFSLSFLLIGGTAIGLATTNFGTLSRYRVPIMPFYAITVVVLTLSVEAERHKARAAEQARRKKGVGALNPLALALARRRRS